MHMQTQIFMLMVYFNHFRKLLPIIQTGKIDEGGKKGTTLRMIKSENGQYFIMSVSCIACLCESFFGLILNSIIFISEAISH